MFPLCFGFFTCESGPDVPLLLVRREGAFRNDLTTRTVATIQTQSNRGNHGYLLVSRRTVFRNCVGVDICAFCCCSFCRKVEKYLGGGLGGPSKRRSTPARLLKRVQPAQMSFNRPPLLDDNHSLDIRCAPFGTRFISCVELCHTCVGRP